MSGFKFKMCALFPHEHFALDTIGFITVANGEKYNTFLRSLFLQTILNVHFPHVLFYKQTNKHSTTRVPSMPCTQCVVLSACLTPRPIPFQYATREVYPKPYPSAPQKRERQTKPLGAAYDTLEPIDAAYGAKDLTVLLHERGCCVWFSLVGRSRGNTKLYLSYVSC